jgi:hypothetical protein
MFYTLAEAAKATGTSRSAILAAIEGGRIPAVKDLFGQWQIEHRELHRLHRLAAQDGPGGDAQQRSSTSDTATLEAELEALLSAVGDGLRQPHEDAPCNRDAVSSREQPAPAGVPDSTRTDLWSPATPSDAPEFIRASSEPLDLASELPEISATAGRETRAPQQATNGRSPAIDQLAIPLPEPMPAWDQEIRIGHQDKVLDPSLSAGTKMRRGVLIGGVMIAALGLGWIGGSGAHLCFDRSASPVIEQRLDSSARSSGSEHRIETPETKREPSSSASSIRKIAIPPATKRAEGPQGAAQLAAASATSSLPPPQNTASASRPSAVQQQAKPESPRTPIPETRPMTIDGWTIRDVVGGTAVLEGPNGVFRATRGDTVPGVGRIYSIVRWGNRWIVATGSGLISTP